VFPYPRPPPYNSSSYRSKPPTVVVTPKPMGTPQIGPPIPPNPPRPPRPPL